MRFRSARPVRLEISLTPSDEVQQLRDDRAELQRKLEDLQSRFNRLEFKYRCESIVNNELIDLCRDHGIKYRPGCDLSQTDLLDD